MVHYRTGFTLLEIMAVIVITSILLSGAFIVFKQPLRKAQELEFKEKIIACQSRLRDQTRQLGMPGTLNISNQELVMEIDGAQKRIPLGHFCRIEQVITRNGREFSSARIGVDIHGVSPTFAIQIIPNKSGSYWLLVVGGSGEVLEFEREQDVKEIVDNS